MTLLIIALVGSNAVWLILLLSGGLRWQHDAKPTCAECPLTRHRASLALTSTKNGPDYG